MRKGIIAGVGAAAGLGAYSSLIEPNELVVERVEVRVPGLPAAFDGFRIVQLSDLHYGPYTGEREIGAAVRQANALEPHLVALTGDFVTSPLLDRVTGSRSPLPNARLCARVLSDLRAPNGVAACLGNHDANLDADAVAAALVSVGIVVLRNSNVVIEHQGGRLWVAGIEDALYGVPDLPKATDGIAPGGPTILLAHEPDFADAAASWPIALQLSGHSHGGQIRVPLLGSPYLPPLAQKYPYGTYRVGNLTLHTSRGIGTIMLPMRFDAPPEVTLITLHS